MDSILTQSLHPIPALSQAPNKEPYLTKADFSLLKSESEMPPLDHVDIRGNEGPT